MGITMKAARVNVGLSQVEAALKIGVSKETLSNYERGQSYPDVLILKKIEKVYGVPYHELIFLPKNYALSVKQRRKPNEK